MQNSDNSFNIHPSWKIALNNEWHQPYFNDLISFVNLQYEIGSAVYPPRDLIFHAFNKTPFDQVRVVIMGQDPYHGPGQAHGLAFSVPRGMALPPSLRNIYKELHDDVGLLTPSHGCLESWAEQGVLLLNATLTVNEGDPLSHHGKGWEHFTDGVIKVLAERKEPIIFVLWGKSAEKKCRALVGKDHHLVLRAPHPSPLSAYHGFFGCKHFSQINQLLEKQGKKAIAWSV